MTMSKQRIEFWALEVLQRVKAGLQDEDVAIELKSVWIDAAQTARRLAAHANAARSSEILWLIGVDSKRGIIGAERKDLANWWPAVRAQFVEDVAPEPVDVVVSFEDKVVVALLFEVERRPYMVRVPTVEGEKGRPDFEVPWRSGTRVNGNQDPHHLDG
jgi:hypothetical protein